MFFFSNTYSNDVVSINFFEVVSMQLKNYFENYDQESMELQQATKPQLKPNLGLLFSLAKSKTGDKMVEVLMVGNALRSPGGSTLGI